MVEVGDELVDYVELVSGFNHDLRFGMKCILTSYVEIVENARQSPIGMEIRVVFVGFKLVDMQIDFPILPRIIFGSAVFARESSQFFINAQTDVIERLECAHRSCSDSNDVSEVVFNVNDCLSRHRDNLCVHCVFIGIFRFDGLERAGSYVECKFGCLNAALTQVFEDILREVQTGSRGSDRAFNATIDRLIGCFVTFLGFAVEIWRNGQFALRLQ